ncbi:MAG: hypothetical protein ACTSXP_13815 [Promethearchaeota archaeon]
MIVDWSGVVPLPIEVRVYPANRNDNLMFRDTFKRCFSRSSHVPTFVAADKGPSCKDSLQLIKKESREIGIIPRIKVRPVKNHRSWFISMAAFP